MTNEKLTSLSRVFGAIGSVCLLTATLIFPGIASAASTVFLDGIMETGEYTGTNSGTESLEWWNDHESDYNFGENQNDLVWEINETSAGVYSVNIFVEVPTYARRMIWVGEDKAKDGDMDTCTVWDDGGSLATNGECGAIPDEYLEAYLEGSHHTTSGDPTDMSYSTQVESEYFQLNGIGVNIGWDEVDTDLTDNITWATSAQYLVDEGICSLSLCLEFDMTSSLEVMWTGLTLTQAQDKVSDITDLQLHLSDEATNLPPIDIPEVPVPAAIWLFGTALIGFIGISRRTNLS
jgi:hypothetical protein